MEINSTKTVRDLAVEMPAATRVFEALGIDYCCGGGRSLQDACNTAGLAVDEVVRSLEEIEQTGMGEGSLRDWGTEPLSQLASYIVNKHHTFTRGELDRLEPLLEKVCSVYGQRQPELLRIQALFRDMKEELITHMLKEEQALFPYVNQMEKAVENEQMIPAAFFGTVRNPIRMMMLEHDRAGEMLKEIRELSSGFTVPADACISYQTLYRALEELEKDLHEHIHLENNLLFPRAVEMEAAAG